MGPDLQSRPGLDEREELGCGRWWGEMFDDEGTEISLDMCRRDVWSKTGQKIDLKHALVELGRVNVSQTDPSGRNSPH